MEAVLYHRKISYEQSESYSDTNLQYAGWPPLTAPAINVKKPKFPQYAAYAKRLESFDAWSEYIPVKKDDMVEAGLVYTGVGDSVRCYFCGGGLRNWEQDDVPMEEHAKWYPECPHVLSVKGHDYVTKVKRREKPRLPNGATTKGLEHIESVAAQVCIAWDFSKEMVMKAIDIYFEQHGNCDFKANDLLLILFEIEEESEIGSDIYTYVKTANTREDSQRHTTYVRGLYTAVQKQDWIVRDKDKRSSGTSAWAASLIKKLMTVLDDTLKTATDIMSLLVKRCPQLFPDLTREPTERDLVTFAEAIGGNFRFLGLDLGLSDAKLDQISLDNPTTVMKTYSMLREWSGKNPLKATVSSLIQTMKSCRSVKIDWNQIGKVCMGS